LLSSHRVPPRAPRPSSSHPESPPPRSTAFQIVDQKCGDAAAPLLASSGNGPAAGELLKNAPLAAVLRRLADKGATEGAARVADPLATGCLFWW
jgi:hypothetical protein